MTGMPSLLKDAGPGLVLFTVTLVSCHLRHRQ
jgi:hypothetical protein